MVWAIVSLVALLVIPGAVVVRASGVRTPWALALGPAVTFGIAGTAGWALGAIEVRFTLVSASICWAVTLLLALCWSGGGAVVSIAQCRPRRSRPPQVDGASWAMG